MLGCSRGIAPGNPLVSISVSFAALRFLSWAEPRVLPRSSGERSSFAWPALWDRRQHTTTSSSGSSSSSSSSSSSRSYLVPLAHAATFNEPLAPHRPPRVMDSASSSKGAESASCSESLWRDCQLEVMRSLHHPWTRGLASGSTSRDSFKRYVAQDAYFLRAFAKVLKAKDLTAGLEIIAALLRHPKLMGKESGSNTSRSLVTVDAGRVRELPLLEDATHLVLTGVKKIVNLDMIAKLAAYAYALIKVQDEEGLRAFHSLVGSVLEELQLHASFAAKWGIDIQNVPPADKATSDYVGFLITVASDPTSSVAHVLASMAPCMRLYAFLGKGLQTAFPTWRESAYAEWIETYGSADFEAAATLVESLLDKYATGVEYPSLLDLYRQAMNLEYAFFAAQRQGTAEDDRPLEEGHSGQIGAALSDAVGHDSTDGQLLTGAESERQWGGVRDRVALLCVDFDDTVTEGDTTSLLVKTAEAQRRSSSEQAESRREWARLGSVFQSEWKTALDESLAAKKDETISSGASGGRLDREGLEAMLHTLEKVDLDSVARVSESKILGGISRDSIRASLGGSLRPEWRLRPGASECLARSLVSEFRTHVVSINWSRDVITSVLSTALEKNMDSPSPSIGYRESDITPDTSDYTTGCTNGLHFDEASAPPVYSNDLVYDEHGMSTGAIAVNVTGSFGKWRHFVELAAATRRSCDDSSDPDRDLTIYVGDSVTDLLALLDADIGIIIGESSSLESVARAFGISVRPLVAVYEALPSKPPGARDASPDVGLDIYRVAHWAEIDVFLFGASQAEHRVRGKTSP